MRRLCLLFKKQQPLAEAAVLPSGHYRPLTSKSHSVTEPTSFVPIPQQFGTVKTNAARQHSDRRGPHQPPATQDRIIEPRQ